MNTKLEVITGNEDVTELSAPLRSLVSFYKAFNSRDYLAAAENWSQREVIGMSNPMGGIRRSWDEIAAGYKRIMSGTAKVYVEYYDFTSYQDSNLFYVYGRERGHFSHTNQVLDLQIRTSRIYKLTAGQWKQVHHHGSIENPQLLAKYQAAMEIR